MDIAKQKFTNVQHIMFKPAISFTGTPAKKFERSEYHAYKLRTFPGDSSSPVYELGFPFYSSNTSEEWLKFQNTLQALFLGQVVIIRPT